MERRRVKTQRWCASLGEAWEAGVVNASGPLRPEYWQQLLSHEAFNALSRQHLQLDVWCLALDVALRS
eukprot:3215114-Amphidinium_carterae.1